MSLIDIIMALEERSRLAGQDLGFPLPHESFFEGAETMLARNYNIRPGLWSSMGGACVYSGTPIKTENDKFQLNIDVKHFAPEEIKVKTADGYVVVEAKHEEKKDDTGLISRQFVKKYVLPEGCNSEGVESKLSSDGVLSITAPRATPEAKNERNVPIGQNGSAKKEKEIVEDIPLLN